jgi:hypothetical protein
MAQPPSGHPPVEPRSNLEKLDQLTTGVASRLPRMEQPGAVERRNYIDDFIFGKMSRDGVPHAPLSTDSEFLRRVSLDLVGRLPGPAEVRSFLADPDPNKRERVIDDLTEAKADGRFRRHPTYPFLDRWTYFFMDVYRIGTADVDHRGRNRFWDFFNNCLLLQVPYNQVVTEMLTATTRSSWESGVSNFLARYRQADADGIQTNHEDSIEDIAIASGKYFLGVNLECVSCHDGAGHLEKINLWLTGRKREEFWRQASFFGDLHIHRPFSISQEIAIGVRPAHRYDMKHPSVKRGKRYERDSAPAFLLTGERPQTGENPRQALARLITTHPQFARATVNLIWAELMGAGIVDPPFEFDLARQDPKNPPPAPWKIQPSHPELLEALGRDFATHDYNLKYIIRTIAKSSAYQLSSRFEGSWKPEYASYFARRLVRRLSAEQLYDAISQATGVFVDIPILGTDEKVQWAMQTRDPADFGREPHIKNTLASFGQSNRDLGEASLEGSTIQASILLNGKLLRERVAQDKGRLGALLAAKPARSDGDIAEELFLATIGRIPNPGERRLAEEQLAARRGEGAEDVLWSLLNKTEFLFNH